MTMIIIFTTYMEIDKHNVLHYRFVSLLIMLLDMLTYHMRSRKVKLIDQFMRRPTQAIPYIWEHRWTTGVGRPTVLYFLYNSFFKLGYQFWPWQRRMLMYMWVFQWHYFALYDFMWNICQGMCTRIWFASFLLVLSNLFCIDYCYLPTCILPHG